MIEWFCKRFGVSREFAMHFLLPCGAMVACAIGLALVPVAAAFLGLGADVGETIKVFGAFGDMFGLLSAVFSGVAFAAIYYTLRIQQKQYEVQLAELDMKREMASLFVDEVASK